MLSIARTPDVGVAPAKMPSIRAARRSLVQKLTPDTARMVHLALTAEQALCGADPEASLVFIQMLRDRCDAALKKAPVLPR